jgi:hypothetical protein
MLVSKTAWLLKHVTDHVAPTNIDLCYILFALYSQEWIYIAMIAHRRHLPTKHPHRNGRFINTAAIGELAHEGLQSAHSRLTIKLSPYR